MPVGVYAHQRKPLAERFWAKVQKTDTCWIWTGARNSVGYGLIASADGPRRMLLAHRVAYELVVGPIPSGMQLDHVCRVRHCVNPAHLEAVTNRENNVRKPVVQSRRASLTCVNGHPWSENTVETPTGGRLCRTCNLIRRHHREALQFVDMAT